VGRRAKEYEEGESYGELYSRCFSYEEERGLAGKWKSEEMKQGDRVGTYMKGEKGTPKNGGKKSECKQRKHLSKKKSLQSNLGMQSRETANTRGQSGGEPAVEHYQKASSSDRVDERNRSKTKYFQKKQTSTIHGWGRGSIH